MNSLWKRIFLRVSTGLLTIGLVAESVLRVCGTIDFPIYETNAAIGYIPAANQAGSFLNKNEWRFNELSMGAGPFKPGPWIDTLLIGDSVVLGGNPITQDDRLGAALERAIGGRVWPVSAGSWAIRNELNYLKTHRAVIASIDQIVFVINSGDLNDRKSQWNCDANHPRQRPILASWYLLEKYILHLKNCTPGFDASEHQGIAWRKEFESFLGWPETRGKPIYVVTHLAVDELATPALQNAAEATMMTQLKAYKDLRFITPAQAKGWGTRLYRDGIHLNANGNQALAAIIRTQKAGTHR